MTRRCAGKRGPGRSTGDNAIGVLIDAFRRMRISMLTSVESPVVRLADLKQLGEIGPALGRHSR